MPIEVRHPRSKTQVARQFVAFGTKEDAQRPLGVVISVDATTGLPDGRHFIDGEGVVFKPDANGRTQVPSKWVIKFRMPSVDPNQRFVLAVFDGAALPTSVCDLKPYIVTDLIFPTHLHATVSNASSGSPPTLTKSIDHPMTATAYSAPDFFAYGTLPTGCDDLVLSKCDLIDTANNSPVVPPDWRLAEYGFWFLFFEPISAPVADATLTVKYTPTQNPESVINIELT